MGKCGEEKNEHADKLSYMFEMGKVLCVLGIYLKKSP